MRSPHRLFAISVIALTGLAAACSQPPQLDGRLSEAARRAPYPTLQPLDMAAMASSAAVLARSTPQSLEGRVASLRRRAAALSGPVIDPATRARMDAAIARHAG